MHTAKRALAVGALVGCAALASAQDGIGPALTAPTQRLSEVVPHAALEGFTLPDAPLRVASRPNTSTSPGRLNWRPALDKAADRDDEAVTDGLTPVKDAPRLVAPKRDSPATDQRPAEPPVSAEPEPSAEPSGEPTNDAVATDRPASEPRRLAPRPPATEPEATAAPKPDGRSTAEPQSSPSKTEKAKPAPEPIAKPLEPLSRGMRNLRSRMRTVLSFYYRQPFNTVEHDAWEIMHGMLAYELQSRVLDGGPRGKPMTAVGHLCFNRPSEGKRMMALDSDGRIDVRVGVGLQGHKGQLLAMLAQCNVSPEYPIRVDNKRLTIRDLVEAEQRTCYARTELTFKLIGLGHYLDSDARWVNDQGESWDIPRLIREEREQPIRGAACGGTHRLAGLSLAHRRREARGEPVDGEYAEAARFVAQYQQYAFRLQNPDGSLSTEWFRGRGAEEDIERRLRTTGHTLEWLGYALSDEELRSYRTVRAATYLTNLLASNANQEWHPGSLSHALHALLVYDKRVFQPHDTAETLRIASTADPSSRLYRGYPIYRGVMRNGAPEPGGFLGLFGGGNRSSSAASRRSR
ncbi:MAG: hypothetical protein AAF805_03315 [Planctomycetota bacterium]